MSNRIDKDKLERVHPGKERIAELELDLKLRESDLEEVRELLSAFKEYDGNEELWTAMKRDRDNYRQELTTAKERVHELDCTLEDEEAAHKESLDMLSAARQRIKELEVERNNLAQRLESKIREDDYRNDDKWT